MPYNMIAYEYYQYSPTPFAPYDYPDWISKENLVKCYVLMRDAEGRKEEASKVVDTTKQSYTTHPRQSPLLNVTCTVMYIYTF